MSGATPQPEGHEYRAETVGAVRVLTIDRPDRQNSLSRALKAGLVDELVRAELDPEIRVIVLTAAGERVFCAGADLKDIRGRDEGAVGFRPPMRTSERNLFEVIAETMKPTIAAVNGAAVGGGFEIALACDIRIASTGAYFALPEAKIGMGAVFGSVVLPKRIPMGIALELMFTGERLSAEDAARWGLVNHVVAPDRLMAEAMALATRIADNAPLTVRRMKEMAVKGVELPLAAAIRLDVGPNPYTSEDRKEGIQAFLEKRKPRWKGR